jgi:uncharacterized protein YoxC
MYNHFQTVEGSESVLVVLEKIKGQQPYVGMDYRVILKKYNEQQQILVLDKVLNNAQKIASSGLEIIKGKHKTKLKGISDSISYIARETKNLNQQLTGIKTEGQIVSEEDVREVKDAYNKAEANPTDSIGIQTWLKEIDESTGGLKSGELMIITAYTGHYKTTFSLNMAYRALYGGWNTAFVTLEMSYNMGDDDIDNTIETIAKCIEFITHEGKVLEADAFTLKERIEFVENLTQAQVNKIDMFFDNIPKTVFEKKYECPLCDGINTVRIEGISNFFA